MRYSMQIWNTTSIFNPTRMNHIEQGIYDADLREGGTISGNLTVNANINGVKTYLKMSETSGNTFNLQLKTYTIHIVNLLTSVYSILITSAFNYRVVTKLSGDELDYSVDNNTGIMTFSAKTGGGTVRNSTNVFVTEYHQ